MRDINHRIKVLALFGKSGAGKDTIQNWMVSNIPNTNGIVSYTTRPPREGEVYGKDYFFIKETEFFDKIEAGLMLEYTSFRGWYYGVGLDQLKKDKINIGVFNINGIKRAFSNTAIDIRAVYIYADDKTRLLRCLGREQSPDCYEICRRYMTDKMDFEKVDAGTARFPFEIYNNNAETDFYRVQNLPEIKKFLSNINQTNE